MKRSAFFRDILLHAVILLFAILTIVPFAFVFNSSLRTNAEVYHGYFAIPETLKGMARAASQAVRGGRSPPAGHPPPPIRAISRRGI